MTTMRLTAFKTAITGASKTLGGSTVSFYLWHLFAPLTQQGKMHGPEELPAS
jgi:hypothetical protein